MNDETKIIYKKIPWVVKNKTITFFPKGTIVKFNGIPCELLEETPFYSETYKKKIEDNEDIIENYDSLAKEFIEKVDTGRVRSKRTYSEFKRILNRDL